MLVIFTGLKSLYNFTFDPGDYHFQPIQIFSNEYFSHADMIICL